MSNILKYQNPSSPLLIQKVNQSGVNFVKRLLDPDRKSIPDWETKGQKIATHKMSWGEDDQGAYVFPEVQEIDDQLIDFSRPPYAPGIADYMAHKNNNIIRMSPEEADWFTRNYKQYYPSFKKGGRIHIKKKNRGKFTEYCGGKVTQECIAKGKKSKDPKIRKRATFAANARKWKHQEGGILQKAGKVAGGFVPLYGTYLNWKDYKENPTLANLGWTIASGLGDIASLTGIGYGIIAGTKAIKAANTARKGVKAINTVRKATRAANQIKMLEYGNAGKNAWKGWVASGKNLANSNKKLSEATNALQQAGIRFAIDGGIDTIDAGRTAIK